MSMYKFKCEVDEFLHAFHDSVSAFLVFVFDECQVRQSVREGNGGQGTHVGETIALKRTDISNRIKQIKVLTMSTKLNNSKYFNSRYYYYFLNLAWPRLILEIYHTLFHDAGGGTCIRHDYLLLLTIFQNLFVYSQSRQSVTCFHNRWATDS